MYEPGAVVSCTIVVNDTSLFERDGIDGSFELHACRVLECDQYEIARSYSSGLVVDLTSLCHADGCASGAEHEFSDLAE